MATHIPNCEADVLIFHSLNIEPDRWYGGDNFTQFQFIQDCGFPGCVQSNHEDPHLLLAEEPGEERRDGEAHVGNGGWRSSAGVVSGTPVFLRTCYCTRRCHVQANAEEMTSPGNRPDDQQAPPLRPGLAAYHEK